MLKPSLNKRLEVFILLHSQRSFVAVCYRQGNYYKDFRKLFFVFVFSNETFDPGNEEPVGTDSGPDLPCNLQSLIRFKSLITNCLEVAVLGGKVVKTCTRTLLEMGTCSVRSPLAKFTYARKRPKFVSCWPLSISFSYPALKSCDMLWTRWSLKMTLPRKDNYWYWPRCRYM